MAIVLIIISIIGIIISLPLAISCNFITKNQETWSQFYEHYQQRENSGLLPEEIVYKYVVKIKIVMLVWLVTSLICLAAGIMLLNLSGY